MMMMKKATPPPNTASAFFCSKLHVLQLKQLGMCWMLGELHLYLFAG